MPVIDDPFAGLPRRTLADAAMSRATALGAGHADVRVERLRSQTLGSRDGRLERRFDSETDGLSVRVIVDGSWGFAADVDLTPEAAARAAERAVEAARALSPLNAERVELADEPVYTGEWSSVFETHPAS